MGACPYCKCNGQMMHLKNEQTVELTVLRVYRSFICRQCRRITVTPEIYLLKRGIALNEESLKRKGGL